MYPVLTYSRDLGDFTYSLPALQQHGLKAIRLIYKGKSESDFLLRVSEIQEKISAERLNLDILVDLPGSKPIIGFLDNSLDIRAGAEYQLVDAAAGSCLPFIPTTGLFSHASFATILPGDVISIADDELNLVVIEIHPERISCRALNSFVLKSGRSLSLKNKAFPFEAISAKDLHLVQHWKPEQCKVTFLVSFTRQAEELRRLKHLQPDMDFIPKIETVLSDEVLLEIFTQCKMVLLGRGDLSVASHPKELFLYQKRLIDLCKEQGKMLIVGTGFLAGIGDGKTPAIAEVMDYGYLRGSGVEGFLIAGSNAHHNPFATLNFMNDFR